jgi:hypothetical protein
MASETHVIEWEGFTIQVCYTPAQWGITSHIELETLEPARAPLPVTETGYRSHFVPVGTVEATGLTVCGYVIAWLEHAAKRPEWREAQQKAAQGELF